MPSAISLWNPLHCREIPVRGLLLRHAFQFAAQRPGEICFPGCACPIPPSAPAPLVPTRFDLNPAEGGAANPLTRHSTHYKQVLANPGQTTTSTSPSSPRGRIAALNHPYQNIEPTRASLRHLSATPDHAPYPWVSPLESVVLTSAPAPDHQSEPPCPGQVLPLETFHAPVLRQTPFFETNRVLHEENGRSRFPPGRRPVRSAVGRRSSQARRSPGHTVVLTISTPICSHSLYLFIHHMVHCSRQNRIFEPAAVPNATLLRRFPSDRQTIQHVCLCASQ